MISIIYFIFYIERHLDKRYVLFCLPSFSFVVLALFWCNKCHTNVHILKKNGSVHGREMIKIKVLDGGKT